MKVRMIVLSLLLAMLCPITVLAQPVDAVAVTAALESVSTPETQSDAKVTYILEIQGPIERGLLYVLRRGIAQAESEGASAIILDMNTPGGLVSTAEDIIKLLMSVPDDMETYTYVNTDALSAGALISLSTKHIYMAPVSRIGASAIVGLTGDIPEGDLKKKHVSALLAIVKSAASKNGYDEDLVEAMVKPDFEYKIGDKIICAEGDLLTLNDDQALEQVGEGDEVRSLLSSGTVGSIEELIEAAGLQDTEIRRLEVSWSEKLARWIELFSIIFLAGGVLGIYIEIKTPGIGVPGALGVILLAIFFWGHNVAGLAGMEELLIFIIGIVLLAIEIFVIPGFGFVGAAGIGCILASLMMAMIQHMPGLPWYTIDPKSFRDAFVTLGVSFISAAFGALLLARYLPETAIFQKIVLNTATTADAGFTPSKTAARHDLVGKLGVTATELRPSGAAIIDDKRMSVVAHGAFIDADTRIVVAEVKGNRIVVDKADSGSPKE